MSNCIFCKIIKNEISSYRIYENDLVIVFLDKFPASFGHLLIVPKKHYVNLEEIDEVLLNELMLVIKKMGLLVKDRLNVLAYNVVLNNGKEAGQIISHLHFHLIPRRADDGLEYFPSQEASDDSLKIIQNKLKID
jgi:histidine triad (HIT) family protein